MKPNSLKAWNIRRLDVRAFAEAEAHWHETRSITDLERLAQECGEKNAKLPEVFWEARGEMRPGTGGTFHVWLHFRASTCVPLTCQRCLGVVEMPLVVDRWFRFVADESTAESQDDDSEEDVLSMEPRPDLLTLLEDELLMALPLVPMHEACPETPGTSAGETEVDATVPVATHPFSVLSTLKS